MKYQLEDAHWVEWRLTRKLIAHTISQRLRQWRKIPPELVPLGMFISAPEQHPGLMLISNKGVVVGVAVGFAVYSLGRKFVVDKQMRLSRQNRKE